MQTNATINEWTLVNLKFHEFIAICDRELNELYSLINIESYDFHVLNGAFKEGSESCDRKQRKY